MPDSLPRSATTPAGQTPSAAWRASAGRLCEWTSLLVASVTVCILPWILGSVIPLARLILLLGAAASMGLCLAAVLITDRRRSRFPIAAILVIGLAGLGVLQLMPIYHSPVSQMQHAVFPELRSGLLSDSSSAAESVTFAANVPRTISASDTRSAVAQWLSVAMLLIVGFETIRDQRRLTVCLSVLSVNACVLTLVGLLQIFGDGRMMFGGEWMLSKTTPFGPFVNPNNAAGWLCIHLAVSLGLMVLIWGKTEETGYSRMLNDPTLADQLRDVIPFVQERLATLNSRQILILTMVVLLLSGVAATLSRAGIIAALFALIACCVSRLRWQQALLLLIPLTFLTFASAIFLAAFELDTLVLSELKTLRDPVSETTGRMLHWTDSLQSVRDFPLLGSGLNAYRFSTLPYQAHAFEKWFQNADNHYVELMIEAGLMGLLLFVLAGLTLLAAGFRLNKVSSTQKKDERPRLLALALMAVVLVASQSVAAAFDFGIGLPANAAAIALLAGAVFAPFADTESERSSLRSLRDVGTIVCPANRMAIGCIGTALAGAALSFYPDLQAANRIYDLVIHSERMLAAPVTQAKLTGIPEVDGKPAGLGIDELDRQLTQQMSRRPDDADGLQVSFRIREAQFRRNLITAMTNDAELAESQFQNIWENLTPPGLAGRLLTLRRQADPSAAEQIQAAVRTAYHQVPWQDAVDIAAQKVAIMPGVAATQLAGDVILFAEPTSSNRPLNVLFSEPSDPRRLFQAGHFCLLQNREDLAVRLWTQTLAISERLRIAILLDALNSWSVDESVRRFAPERYEHTIAAALAIPNDDLKSLLWNRADSQWEGVRDSASLEQQLQRASHLQHRVDDAAATEWLETCLAEAPDNLKLSVLNAQLLEKQNRKRDALNEWIRIQYFHPDQDFVATAINRISNDL